MILPGDLDLTGLWGPVGLGEGAEVRLELSFVPQRGVSMDATTVWGRGCVGPVHRDKRDTWP